MTNRNALLRIFDANVNRAKEGLRVCEDICRYIWNDSALTAEFKQARHGVTRTASRLGLLEALAARDIEDDVGRATTASEMVRPDVTSVFWANMQRVKESLRVLEEVSKLLDSNTSRGFKKLRYQAYAIEKKALKKG